MTGVLLGYLAIIVFAMAFLVALGVLIAGRTSASRIILAAGLLAASIIAAVATLTFLGREFHEHEYGTLIVLMALTYLLTGIGQFIAALRGPGTYVAALGCAAGSLVLLWTALLGGTDALERALGVLSRLLPGVRLLLALASLPIAATSVMAAIFLPVGSKRTRPGRGRSQRAGLKD
jgi:hypothetical protein